MPNTCDKQINLSYSVLITIVPLQKKGQQINKRLQRIHFFQQFLLFL